MKKILCLMLSMLLVTSALTGCSIEVGDGVQEESDYCFYYLNGAETELLSEAYVPQEETSDFMVKDLMQRLGKKEKEGDASNLLPEDVSIVSFDLQDSLLVIDFSDSYNDMSRSREILARAGIVKTFLQMPNITAVRFTVGGADLLNSKNEKLGDMTADTFVEYSKNSMEAYRYETFTLYFADETGENLVKEQRNVYYKRSLSRERVVLEQLAKGPMVKGNYPTISGDTMVLSISTSDNICYVNLDQSFLDYSLDVSEEVAVYSVVNSLLAASDMEKVQISIEGETDGYFREKLPLYSFYEKNDDLVLKEE